MVLAAAFQSPGSGSAEGMCGAHLLGEAWFLIPLPQINPLLSKQLQRSIVKSFGQVEMQQKLCLHLLLGGGLSKDPA